LQVKSPDALMRRLREVRPAVIARVEDDRILFDPRTVLDDERLLMNLKSLLLENE
jgi:L-seryl-tRNA(Ser) seleniumtransferase